MPSQSSVRSVTQRPSGITQTAGTTAPSPPAPVSDALALSVHSWFVLHSPTTTGSPPAPASPGSLTPSPAVPPLLPPLPALTLLPDLPEEEEPPSTFEVELPPCELSATERS